MKKRYIKNSHPYIAENLRILRKFADKPQRDLACALGIDRSTYAYWENAKGEPSLEIIMILIDYYNNLNIFDFELDYNLLLSKSIEIDDSKLNKKPLSNVIC